MYTTVQTEIAVVMVKLYHDTVVFQFSCSYKTVPHNAQIWGFFKIIFSEFFYNIILLKGHSRITSIARRQIITP